MSQIITIPCGRYDFNQDTKKVTMIKAKGLLMLELNEENELKLSWINLDQNDKVEIERYIFNMDAKFQKVKGQNRVYLLNFQTEETKYFFYMQGDDITKDEEFCNQFNELIAKQILDEPSGQIQEEVIQNTVNQPPLQQSQPMQIEQQAQPQFQQQYQDILRLLQQQTQNGFTLTDVLNQEFLHQIANDPDYINALVQHLPPDQQNQQRFKENLLSPQLRQALDQLSHALRDKDRAAVLMQLELDHSVFQQEFDGVLAFIKAIIKKVDQEQQQQQQQQQQ